MGISAQKSQRVKVINLTQRVMDLEAGLAEQSRILAETRQTLDQLMRARRVTEGEKKE